MKKKINLPNKITIFRMLVVIAILILAVLPQGPTFGFENIQYDYRRIIILVLFILGSFSDFLDGHIARKNNIVTTFGKFMDPIADKLLVNTLFVILAGVGEIHWIIPVIMISRDTIVDAIRMIVVEQGTVIAASKLGKLKTVTQMIALILILAFPGVWYMVLFAYVAAIASLVSGVDYFWKNRKVLLSDLRG